MGGFYIGMDVGGTHLRLRLADAGGRVLGDYEGPGCTVNLAGFEHVRAAYGGLIGRALGEHGLEIADCRGLCAGAAGVDSPALEQTYRSIFEGLGFPAARVRVYNDCEVFLHLHEGRAGVVAVAGTGAITFGLSARGKAARCGGWGHLLSDEGSGCFLVRRAMEEVIHHLDGCASCPVLAKLLMDEVGLFNQHDLSLYFFRNIAKKSEIARHAPVLDHAARLGDPVAAGILRDAAERIFASIRTVAEQVRPGNGAPFSVLLWGSVLVHSEPVAAMVSERVREAYPQASVGPPERSALETAMEIAKKLS